jgi:hypothetical protein
MGNRSPAGVRRDDIVKATILPQTRWLDKTLACSAHFLGACAERLYPPGSPVTATREGLFSALDAQPHRILRS